jgi:membrane-bound ClpP family serine protease
VTADNIRVAILLVGGLVFLGIGLFARAGFTFGPAGLVSFGIGMYLLMRLG